MAALSCKYSIFIKTDHIPTLKKRLVTESIIHTRKTWTQPDRQDDLNTLHSPWAQTDRQDDQNTLHLSPAPHHPTSLGEGL